MQLSRPSLACLLEYSFGAMFKESIFVQKSTDSTVRSLEVPMRQEGLIELKIHHTQDRDMGRCEHTSLQTSKSTSEELDFL